MSLTARTSRDVLHVFQDHLNKTLNRTLTRYRLRFFLRSTKSDHASLAFFNNRGVAIAVPLPPTPWHLSINYELQAVPEGKEHGLKILEYKHRLHRTSSIDDEAEVRFEYVSPDIDPDFPYSRHHVQFHRDARSASSDDFSLSKLHIPTGCVTIEHVIRFLIADLDVPPLTEQWEAELQASEERSREWRG